MFQPMGYAGDSTLKGSAGRVALCVSFIGQCDGDIPFAELIRDFAQIACTFGFAASACAAWVTIGSRRSTKFFFRNWPADWEHVYVSRGWAATDVMLTEVARKMRPYSWDEARNGREPTDAEAEVDAAAGRYGWIERFAVPIHGPGGYQGVVLMDAKSRCELSAADAFLLQAAALALHERCRKEQVSPNNPAVELSKREIECLKWVAAGKTDWEIAQLLGVAAPTVHFHVERAKKKLNTKTRAQAVAVSVLHGML
jgi:LuxR family quorum sensing-dependent transcriptional regulator